jgi:hypothetical protein
LPFAQADTRAPTVFVDKFDTGGFEGSPDDVESGSAWIARLILQLMNSHSSDSSPLSEILLAPCDKSASCSALGGCDHPALLPKT